MKHLLVTNDYPPKIGGIQSYLWELWRRLDPNDFAVLTTPYEGDRNWDAQQAYEVVRTKQGWLLPTKSLVREVNDLARRVGAELVVLDPVLPLGLIGPRLDLPYVGIAHGAEYAIPDRLPMSRSLVRKVTRNAAGMIASGDYVAGVVKSIVGDRDIPIVSIPPGVDPNRFVPLSQQEKLTTREKFGIPADATVVLGVSRLVPRKGFHYLIRAASALRKDHPGLHVYIAGSGRESERLQKLIDESRAPVGLLGRVADEDLPALYGAADVFCMPCHDRWFGLEREGFGIVFVEAAAAGVCSVAGASGGSGEAVVDGKTGYVVEGSDDAVADALRLLLSDSRLRQRFGADARTRAVDVFSYDTLASELRDFVASVT